MENRLIVSIYRHLLIMGCSIQQVKVVLTPGGWVTMDVYKSKLYNRGIARRMEVQEYFDVIRDVRA